MTVKDKLKICFGKRRFPTSLWVDEFLGHVMESGCIDKNNMLVTDIRVRLFGRIYDIAIDKSDVANSMGECHAVNINEEASWLSSTECVWADLLPSRKVLFCFWEWLYKVYPERFMTPKEFYEASILRHLSTPGDMGSSENI